MPDLPRPHRDPPNDAASLTRIWPSIVLGLIAPCFAGLPIVFMFWDRITVSKAESEALLKEPPFIAAMLVAWPLTLLLMSVLAAFRSRVDPDVRVGLQPITTPAWIVLILMLGGFGLGRLCQVLMAVSGLPPSEGVPELIAAIGQSSSINQALIVFAILIGAPVAEEMFYRGYVLRGLLRKWSPWRAIFFTAWFFSLPNGDAAGQLQFLLFGLYLGWIAYRTRSIWPGVLTSMYLSLFLLLAKLWPAEQQRWIISASGMPSILEIIGYIALPIGIWLLSRPGLFETQFTLDSEPGA